MKIEELKDFVKAIKLVRAENLNLFEKNIELKNRICDMEIEIAELKEKSIN